MERNNSEDDDCHKQSKEECLRNLDDATKEWDEVQEIVPSFANEMKNCSHKDSLPASVKYTALVSVAPVLDDFRNQDLRVQRSEAEVRVRFKK